MAIIDLYSDTKTRPTAAMRQAIASAEVGDEQKFEDPTINRLRDRVCELLGKPDAVFLPSGTMCNEIAIALHCAPGDELIAATDSHVIDYEGGGAAALAGAMVRALPRQPGLVPGTFDAVAMRAAVRGQGRHFPTSRLVCVEQTVNTAGGRIWPLQQLRGVAAAASELGLATHMDGARLMNAVVASGVSAADYAQGFDTVWIDFSKGLGCPVGAMLAGSSKTIARAWKLKQRWGGAMRQAGILGAAALYALDHHVERLAQDHANAQLLAAELAKLDGVDVDPAGVQTNIVFFEVVATGMQADEVCAALAREGVQMGAFGPTTIRAVTHLDVSREDVFSAVACLSRVLRRQA
ncbi:MAG: GntG family PLP-dependent aldolase [Quisquiliibacterium sp.]